MRVVTRIWIQEKFNWKLRFANLFYEFVLRKLLADKLLARVGNGVVSKNADGIAFTSLGLRTPEVFLILDFNTFTVAEPSNSKRFLHPWIHKDKLHTLLTEHLKSNNVLAIMGRAYQEGTDGAKILETRRP